MPEFSPEERRLNALRALAILDTEPEPEFDEIVRLAAAICGVPISMVSLLDEDRQWFKASVGLSFTETERSSAFCNHTVLQSSMLLVEDAEQDARFRENPMVTGPEHWRFYAGFPLTEPGGHAIGALCVIDQQPRRLAEEQKTALRILASQVSSRLELRVRRHQLEQALQERERERSVAIAMKQRFEQFMDNSPFLSYIKDADGRILYYNQPFANQFQVTMHEMLGKTNEELWPENAANYRHNDLAVLTSGKLQISQERSNNPDGSSSVWRSYKFPCTDTHGNTLLAGISVDVTDQLRRQEELEQVHRDLQQANVLLQQLASFDTLTGLALRHIFDEELRRSFRAARSAGQSLCVVLMDVDDFKLHNDRFGHAHGDRVLQALGSCLLASLRPDDLVARYGGEEFAILLTHDTAADVPRIVERLLATVRTLRVDDTSITVSAGLCCYSHSTENTRRLMANADAALFAAKRAGKDRVVVFEEPSQPSVFHATVPGASDVIANLL